MEAEVLHRACKFRIYPTAEQEAMFRRISGCGRFVFNWALEWRQKSYEAMERDENGKAKGVFLKYDDQQNALPGLKKIHEFLKEVPSHCLQAALRDLDDAYSRFISGQNERPTFRSKGEPESFRFPDPTQFRLSKMTGVRRSRKSQYLYAPKFGMKGSALGPIEVVVHQPIRGKIKSCTISRKGEMWFVSFLCEFKRRVRRSFDNAAVTRLVQVGEIDEIKAYKNGKKPRGQSKREKAERERRKAEWKAQRAKGVKAEMNRRKLAKTRVMGVDRNVGKPIVTSEGDVFGKATLTPERVRRLARLQRDISRKEEALRAAHGRKPGASLKGLPIGANLRKARKRLQAFWGKVTRQREDMLHKITSELIEMADIFVLEDLKLDNMTASAKGTVEEPGRNVSQKSGLNRSLLDKALGRFDEMLTYKCRFASRVLGQKKAVIRVNPAHTSQRCSQCGFVHADNRNGEAFLCLACGHSDHADENAAKNIRERGLEPLAHAFGVDLDEIARLLGLPVSSRPGDHRLLPLEGKAVGLPTCKKEENSVSGTVSA